MLILWGTGILVRSLPIHRLGVKKHPSYLLTPFKVKDRKGLHSPFWNISSCTGCSCTGCFCTGCFCGGSAASAVLAAAAFSGPGNEPLETAHKWAGRSPQQALHRTTLNTLQPCYWTFSAASTQQDNSQHKFVIELNVLCSKHSAGQLSTQACYWTERSLRQALSRTTLNTSLFGLVSLV